MVEFRVPNNDQVEIYYTTDGSVPTVASNHYTQPLRVSENTTLDCWSKHIKIVMILVVTNQIINPITGAKAPVITPGSGTQVKGS